MQAKKHSAGFTIIEIMIVIVVLAVLVTIAIPNLRQINQKSRVKNVSQSLTSAFVLARSEAVKRAAEVAVCVSSDGVNCTGTNWVDGFLVVLGPDSTPPDTTLRTIGASEGITVQAASGSDAVARIVYAGNGSADYQDNSGSGVGGATAQFTLATDCWSKTIGIEVTGRVENSASPTFLDATC
jgi:type IV fimbrial biogenesis protein FimT